MNASVLSGVSSFRRVAGFINALAVVGLVWTGVASAQVTTDPKTNLIRNGSFETATTDPTWPDAWNSPRLGSWSWEKDEAGGRYVRLNTTEPNQVLLLYQLVDLPADVKALELTLRARVIGLRCGTESWFDARVMTDFKSASGAKVRGAKTITFRKDTEGWVERKVTFTVPEEAVALEIMPTLFRTYAGTFDIDEIALRSVPAPAPVAPAAGAPAAGAAAPATAPAAP